MTIKYTKIVNQLTCYSEIDNETDVVFTINWTLSGNEGTLYANGFYSTNVSYVAGQPFIPYADLTQEQVLAWIDEYTAPEMMASYEKTITDNIEQQKIIVTPPLPWIPQLP